MAQDGREKGDLIKQGASAAAELVCPAEEQPQGHGFADWAVEWSKVGTWSLWSLVLSLTSVTLPRLHHMSVPQNSTYLLE